MRTSLLAVVLLSGLAVMGVLADPAGAVVVDLKPEGATGPVTLEVQIEGQDRPTTVKTDPATGTARIDVEVGKRITVSPRDPSYTGAPVTHTVTGPTTLGVPVRPAIAASQPFPGSAGSQPDYVPRFGFIPWNEIGAMFANLPRVNYGTAIPGGAGSEVPIVRSDDSIPGPRVGVGVDVPVTARGSLSARLSYAHSSDTTTGGVAVGGFGVAQVYLAPFNNSTGVALGATGANVKIESEAHRLDLDLLYRHAFYTSPTGAFQFTGGLGIGYRRWSQSHEASQTSPVFLGIHSNAEIESETNIIGPLFEIGVAWRPTRDLSLGLTGTLLPGYGFGSGSADQRNFCNLCPAAQQAFRIEVEDDKSDFALAGGLAGRIGYSVTDWLQLGVTGGYELQKNYSWDIPESPLEQPARLQRRPAGAGFVGAYIRFTF